MTTISNKVRYYNFAQFGAPELSGTAGALVALLDACLVNGYGSKTINTLTVAGNTATGNISAGHTFEVGAVLRVSGATPAALNGDWRVASVTGSDVVWSVEGLGIAEGVATGTITAMYAPAGWQKLYTATNKAAYRSLDYASHNGMILYVDDTGAKTARTRGYVTMSSISAGTGMFPTSAQKSGGCWWGKSEQASSVSRNWALVADSKRICFSPCVHSSYPNSGSNYMFGRLQNATDDWAHVINSALDASYAEWYEATANSGAHVCPPSAEGLIWLPRAKSGAGTSVAGVVRNLGSAVTSGGTGYPTASLSDTLFAGHGVVGDGSGYAISYRGQTAGYAHLYADIASAVAGFEVIGAVGSGSLVMLSGLHSAAFLVDLGTNGRWD